MRCNLAPIMTERAGPKAVLDTNVLVSGLMGGDGPPQQILNAWLHERFTLVTSPYLVAELTHVLSYPKIADRIELSEAEIDAILAALLSQAKAVPGNLELRGVTCDAKDDAVVACAVEAGADYIVSGDQDLLVLSVYEGVQMIAPGQFVEILSAR